ncbi:MAG: LysR family transcriptional regulator [Bacillota bacterium]
MFQGMEYVYEVYKEGSFTKAAQNLYISQPSLSATIKKIETRIGNPIFDRSTSPIRLTECGKEYVKCVKEILEIQNRFNNYLNDTNELKTGQLVIGASNLFASFVLPPLISEFTQRYPLVKINIVEANTPLLEERLLEGFLDLVIDNYQFNEAVYAKHIFCLEHLLLVVPDKYVPQNIPEEAKLTACDVLADKHILTAATAIKLNHFGDSPFVFLKIGNDTRKRSDKICQNQNFEAKIILELDQQITAYNLACYGMGIAFVSDTLIKKVKPDLNVTFYKLDDAEAQRAVCFYHKQGRYLTRAMEEFLKIAIH